MQYGFQPQMSQMPQMSDQMPDQMPDQAAQVGMAMPMYSQDGGALNHEETCAHAPPHHAWNPGA